MHGLTPPILDETFRVDLAAGKPATASNTRTASTAFDPGHLTDGDPATDWAADDGVTNATISVDFGGATEFDHVVIQEDIAFGQRITAWTIEAQTDASGDWQELARGTTVGRKRIVRFEPTTARRLRLRLDRCLAPPVLNTIGVFRSTRQL